MIIIKKPMSLQSKGFLFYLCTRVSGNMTSCQQKIKGKSKSFRWKNIQFLRILDDVIYKKGAKKIGAFCHIQNSRARLVSLPAVTNILRSAQQKSQKKQRACLFFHFFREITVCFFIMFFDQLKMFSICVSAIIFLYCSSPSSILVASVEVSKSSSALVSFITGL